MPALKQQYLESVLPELMKTQGYKNALQVPTILKIVLNSGISAASEKDRVKEVSDQIGQISGQKPVIRKARKSISNFKLREGMPVGVKATLRGKNMWEFLYRLIAIALPNTRDFRGISTNAFDGRGNYTLGVPLITIFPEISSEGTKKDVGLDITIVTSAKNNEEGLALLKLIGMPFRITKKTTAETKE
ncbi:MAG: 50S ribosomal protein L5 [Verrucomicrobia bacterium]|nr:MAG: 50S ribosomal protein L5 [Verrucomicrobiota bacterium]